MTVLKPSFLATLTPGAIALKSTKELNCRFSTSSALSAVTACDRSCRLSVRFSAVTNTSSKMGACCAQVTHGSEPINRPKAASG